MPQPSGTSITFTVDAGLAKADRGAVEWIRRLANLPEAATASWRPQALAETVFEASRLIFSGRASFTAHDARTTLRRIMGRTLARGIIERIGVGNG